MDSVPLDWLRALYDDWGRGDFRVGGDRLAPQFRFSTTADFPDPVSGTPETGLSDYWRGFLGSWSRLRIEAEEIVPTGDRAFVRVPQSGTGRVSGAETTLAYFHVWRFRNGDALSLDAIMDEGAAHEEQRGGLYDAWARGEFEVGAALFAPEIEFVVSEGFPNAPTAGTGVPGLERWRELFLTSFRELRIEAQELVANGSRVLARVRQHDEFHSGGILTDTSYWQAWWLRGGVVTRWQAFPAEADARAAIAL